MKNFYLILFLIFGIFSVRSESNVYIFYPKSYNMTYDISVNGTKLEDTDPPIKKTVNFDSHVTPFNYMERAYKPIIITEDGKYVIVVKINYTNSVNGKTVSYWTEQPVVMEDGEEVFLDIVYKGMSDFKIKEIDSKKGNKKLMDKKLYRLPESTI